MPLLINLRHVETRNVGLKGELSVAELDIDTKDELIQVTEPLVYELEVQRMEGGLLVQGRLVATLDCLCSRCLKPFKYELALDPWTAHLPLEGEESVAVVNDCVDLTPYVREDILLEFPQHPLCEQECRGLPETNGGKAGTASSADQTESISSSAWAELNKLKL
jgi:uncharacterized protein